MALASFFQEKVRGEYYVQNVRQLSLIGNSLTDEHIALLAPAFSKMSSLDNLRLSNNLIGDHGCQVLARALPRKLASLIIGRNRICERGAAILSNKARYVNFVGNPNVPKIIKSHFELIERLDTLWHIKTYPYGFLTAKLGAIGKDLMNMRYEVVL